MSDKKAELAKKRALLNELRRKKSERTQTLQVPSFTTQHKFIHGVFLRII